MARRKKAPSIATRGFYKMAQRTGLEPATPGVTGRYSNQLNYRCASVQRLRSIGWRKRQFNLTRPSEQARIVNILRSQSSS
jgi:hypothetical protein